MAEGGVVGGATVAVESAVVAGEDDGGAVGDVELFEFFADAADGLIDGFNHGGVFGVSVVHAGLDA